MSKVYQWGIIGPGKIARKFANALKLTDRGALRAVASRDPERAKAFAAEFDCATSYDSYEQLASDPKIDAIYIATPHAFHLEHAGLCLENGKAVLCEKPLALSAAQVRSLTDIAQKHHSFLMEAMWTRFTPISHTILRTIKEGQIGEVRYIKADFGFPAPADPHGRLYNLALGGGSLLDIGIYPLFLCTLLMGKPDKIKASGRLSEQGADIDCHAILEYSDNRAATFTSSIGYQTAITAEIIGTKGQIQIPCPWYKNYRFNIQKDNGSWQEIALPPMVNGFEYEINAVADSLDQGLKEHSDWPLSSSLQLASLMDEIKKQIGVRYPGE